MQSVVNKAQKDPEQQIFILVQKDAQRLLRAGLIRLATIACAQANPFPTQVHRRRKDGGVATAYAQKNATKTGENETNKGKRIHSPSTVRE